VGGLIDHCVSPPTVERATRMIGCDDCTAVGVQRARRSGRC